MSEKSNAIPVFDCRDCNQTFPITEECGIPAGEYGTEPRRLFTIYRNFCKGCRVIRVAEIKRKKNKPN